MKKLRRREWINLPADERVKVLGHRAFVGGTNSESWYGIGKRQYHWLVSKGLRPEHRFLDIACGSLRLGQFLIPYLNEACYFGLEPEKELVEQGLKSEIFYDLAKTKKPCFAHNYDFDCSFVERYDFAIAQSLVTHLNDDDITGLLTGLRKVSQADSMFFFTFFEGESEGNPQGPSHANKSWHYPFSRLAEIGNNSGWALTYIGDWNHARGQKMVMAKPM